MPLQLTVFFDGGCPLCRREIGHYRRIERPGRIHWVDVTSDIDQMRCYGLEPRAALASFHVRAADGEWQTGASAFVLLWRHLPGYRWLARLCEGLHLVPLMDWVYARFARWHFEKRCREGACGA